MESTDRLRWILDLVEGSLDQPELTGEDLAARAFLSRFHFGRLAAAARGEPPGAFRRRLLDDPAPSLVSLAARRAPGREAGGPVAQAPPGGYRGLVAERRWAGSWLSGATSAGDKNAYPGEELGLPESGPGSVASVGRRLGALVIDWLMCEIISIALFRSQFLTIAVFAVEAYVLTALTGFTVGKRLLGLRVARLDGKPIGLLWALVRTVLFLAVVPPLIFDQDLRGLHDKAANTVVIRT